MMKIDNKDMDQDKQPIEEPSAHEIMDCKRVFTRMKVPLPDLDEEWKRLNEKTSISSSLSREGKQRRSYTLMIGFITGVAASVVVLFGFYRLYILPHKSPIEVFKADENTGDISLAFSSGEKYNLSGAGSKSLQSKGIKANKDSLIYTTTKSRTSPNLLTVSTPRGKDFFVKLPDGTKAWLNADSKLIFPERFANGKRTVQLKGEAYFEVKKDARHPFVVNGEYFSTTVLGTKFNMKSYAASSACVVLLEGKVTLVSANGGKAMTLAPGQKAQLESSGSFDVQHVDTYAYVQWKDGYFYFNNVPLVDIMQELGRWYNMGVIIENPRVMNMKLHFVADRNAGINDALRNLNAIGDVHAIISENKIVVD